MMLLNFIQKDDDTTSYTGMSIERDGDTSKAGLLLDHHHRRESQIQE